MAKKKTKRARERERKRENVDQSCEEVLNFFLFYKRRRKRSYLIQILIEILKNRLDL